MVCRITYWNVYKMHANKVRQREVAILHYFIMLPIVHRDTLY
jgi:hypothetical protein